MIVGTEWLIEATGCAPEALRDEAKLRGIFASVINDLGLKVIDSVWHKFDGEGGVTGLVALTESHLACHTYPEHGTATFNLYCCRTRPEWDWDKNLKAVLDAENVFATKIERGTKDRNAGVPPAVLSASRTQVPNSTFVEFGNVSIRNRGRLPHWEQDEGIYFVTFRLADSLPVDVRKTLADERRKAEEGLENLNRELRIGEKKKLDWLFSEKVDDYLAANYGECILKYSAAAKIVCDALKQFDDKRYQLFAWCVMPNHAHVVFRTLAGNKLAEILHAWKSFTAHEINRILGRTGELWQREYYDHLVRDEQELERVIRYTLDNPSKAGLVDWEWTGSFGKYRKLCVENGTGSETLPGQPAGTLALRFK